MGRPWTLDQSVDKAGLIFEGTVVAIAFRDSDPFPDNQVTLPHTFVTYQVEDVLRGRPASRRMTLRFLGGWSDRSGRIMMISHAPLFKLGDRDILFVSGNGAAACPLVACGLGRFRVWQDRVYTDAGLAVRQDADGALRFGPDRLPAGELTMEYPPAPEARLSAIRQQLEQDRDVSDSEREALLRRLRDMSAPRVIGRGREVTDRPIVVPPFPPLDATGFKVFVAEISERYPSDENPMPTASLGEPFQYPPQELRRAQPPGRVSLPPSQPPTLEQQLLRRNNGNPVLGAQ